MAGLTEQGVSGDEAGCTRLALRPDWSNWTDRASEPPRAVLVALAGTVGVVGGLVGVGGGSILAPVLAGFGRLLGQGCPRSTADHVCDVVGGRWDVRAAGGQWRSCRRAGEGARACPGVWGGMVGAYLGARAQPYVRESVLRRGLGVVAVALGAAYAWSVMG